MYHHFILTRFNLSLWQYDKHNRRIEGTKWLEKRLVLFESYCLPSVVGQSCQNFIWILLCDENTPLEYRERIKEYRKQCPQIELIQVEEGYAWNFPNIFSEVVTSMLEARGANDGDVCITTQLDNDDAINKDYIDFIQRYILENKDVKGSWKKSTPLFLSFDYGLQYFTCLNMATRVKYPNNHFMTCVETVKRINTEQNGDGVLFLIGTCFGYGSHFLLEKEFGMCVEHIVDKTKPMWCEVIHKDNVDNDVKMTLGTYVITDMNVLINSFNICVTLSNNRIGFFKRFIVQAYRRAREKFIHRKWR